jgi:enoyl-CoA hydratase/carnithine racemase
MGETKTITVERRDAVVLIGIDRASAQNRIDPSTFAQLGRAYFEFEQDEALRVAVLFGHGAHFSAGLDAEAFAPLLLGGGFSLDAPGTINPLQTTKPRLTKPLVAVVHGNTLFWGHELFLAADVRVAATDAVFSQGETSRAVFPGGGGTVRFVREAGWAQAMRYILTGDTWGADEARRMSLVCELAPNAEAAFERGLELARKIAAAAPLATRTTLASAQQAINEGEEEAFAALVPAFIRLLKTEDFQERIRAVRERREPVYTGR